LFNQSTDAAYSDTVTLHPILNTLSGEALEGPAIPIPPFGAGVVDVAEHFGEKGLEFFRKNDGRGSLSISHVGNALTSFYFQMDRATQAIESCQHTQPPTTVLYEPGVWWGRLRRWAL